MAVVHGKINGCKGALGERTSECLIGTRSIQLPKEVPMELAKDNGLRKGRDVGEVLVQDVGGGLPSVERNQHRAPGPDLRRTFDVLHSRLD